MDNTDLIQTSLSREEYWELVTKLQAVVNLCEKCTEGSGRCLVPEKIWWILIDVTWYEGKWEYTSDM